MLIFNVVGARPNFVKMAPIVLEMKRRRINQTLIHTGQHYDELMSKIFFEELNMPKPDINLGVGSGTHAEQTGRIMTAFEKYCLKQKPDLIMVGGDVNSTLACALVAAKLNIPLGHVESGLRSFDRTMPEEINRIMTDHVASFLFVTEPSGIKNLVNEGIKRNMIYHVGNTMIDSLLMHVKKAVSKQPWKKFDLKPEHYGVVTLHRPSNVDQSKTRESILKVLNKISQRIPLIFPVHPRTKALIQNSRLNLKKVILVNPLGYLDFLGLMAKAKFVLTDSGGIQEETTVLNAPCLTLRNNTERPITISHGTNQLVGMEEKTIYEKVKKILKEGSKKVKKPSLWDGHASQRIVDILRKNFQF